MSGCAKNYRVKKEPNTRYSTKLEQYDYIPYFNVSNSGKRIQIHTEAGKYLFFLMAYNLDKESFDKYNDTWNKLGIDGKFFCFTYETCDLGVNQFFDRCLVFKFGIKKEGDIKLFVINRNLKIEKVYNDLSDLGKINIQDEMALIKTKNENIQSPVFIVQDVITEEMRLEILEFWNNNKHSTTDTKSKHRIDAYPDKTLELKLDDKFTKSLLPELKKVYHIDIDYRETYKVCCYDAEFNGRFHPHRDTPHPYSHRRYAFVLALNNEFEGGGLRVPEYGDKLYVPPVRSAIIFPCMCYHEVVPIQKGKRFVVISFFFSQDEIDAKDKIGHTTCINNNQRYKFKTKRDIYNINLSDIYPKSK